MLHLKDCWWIRHSVREKHVAGYWSRLGIEKVRDRKISHLSGTRMDLVEEQVVEEDSEKDPAGRSRGKQYCVSASSV